MSGLGEPVFLEVVERTPAFRPDEQGPAALIKPNHVRLNGQPLAVPAGETIEVHGMGLNSDELVSVTLTLWCRGVRVAREADDEASGATAAVPSPGPIVTLPEFWEVAQHDGTTPYPDEPDVLIPAGAYLLGRAAEDDPETTHVILRAECAIDPEGTVASYADVLQAMANRLNAARAHGVHVGETA